MSVFMRIVSLILVVIALMLMGADLVTSLERGGHIAVRSIATVWDLFDQGGPDAFKLWASGQLPSFIANAIGWLLGLWSWAVVGGLGVILAFIFGRKHEEV